MKSLIPLSNNTQAVLLDSDRGKFLISKDYNYVFHKSNGLFIRFGEDANTDAKLELGLPEIADIEISTICSGVHGVCQFCYKSNTPNGTYMSLDTFKQLFDKLPKSITQIAFGIGNIEANPDMFKIFEYSRSNGVIPNVTINGYGLTNELATKLYEMCGAVAVSLYDHDLTYDAIKMLTDLGMNQINIHAMISEQTFDNINKLLNDKIGNDQRLAKLNAIVFLSLKKKGRAINNSFTRLSDIHFSELIHKSLENDIPIGFDSCSAHRFLNEIQKNYPNRYEELEKYVEPCEACLYSSYIDVSGIYYPCSFATGEKEWKDGLNVLECDDFINDIWNNKKTVDSRKIFIENRNNKIACPYFDI